MDESPGRFPPPPEPGAPPSGQPPPYGQGPPYGQPPPYSPPPYGPPGYGYPPGPPSFYPLDLNRILELTFSLFRFRWRTFVGIALLVMVPAFLVLSVGSALTYDANAYVELGELARRPDFDLFLARFWQTLLTNLVVNVALSAIVSVAGFIATGALSDTTAMTISGGSTKATVSVRRSLSRIATYIGIWLAMMLLVFAIVLAGVLVGGALFLATATEGQLVPGPLVFGGLIVFVATIVVLVFLLIRFALVAQVAMLESAGPIDALRRSWYLVSGSTWRVLGYLLLFGLVIGLIVGLLSAAISLALNPVRATSLTTFAVDPVRLAIATFLSGLISAALSPIIAIAMTLLYFDLRARRGEQVPQPGGMAPATQSSSVSE